jgi:hypothetical protein
VGHVDEFMTFLPAPETPLGYVMIRADPALGMSLLQAMTPEERVQSLERTADAALRSAPLNPEVIDDDGAFLWETLQSLADVHGLLSDPATARSVDEELDVEELLEINRRASGIIAESQSRVRQAIEKRQQPGVHLEVLSFPTLYVNTSDGNLTTLVPEATNLLVLGRHLVIPDPLIPEFRKEVREVSEGLGYRVHFLSSLTYHDGFGQLHCASQVLRDPGRFVHPRYRDPARGSVQRLSRN